MFPRRRHPEHGVQLTAAREPLLEGRLAGGSATTRVAVAPEVGAHEPIVDRTRPVCSTATVFRILTAIDRFNRAHPWSHNDAYVVLREARKARRAGGNRALDVGCGTGNLVARLAQELREVTGVEADATTASLAAAALSAFPNVRIAHARFPQEARAQFDLVSMVAVLHHMPLDDVIGAVARAQSAGGRGQAPGARGPPSSANDRPNNEPGRDIRSDQAGDASRIARCLSAPRSVLAICRHMESARPVEDRRSVRSTDSSTARSRKV